MTFEILGEISEIETFAAGSSIREVARLRRVYGRGRWRKRKGVARIRLSDGSVHVAEIHWYEARPGSDARNSRLSTFFEENPWQTRKQSNSSSVSTTMAIRRRSRSEKSMSRFEIATPRNTDCCG